jgi:hypothetical protein
MCAQKNGRYLRDDGADGRKEEISTRNTGRGENRKNPLAWGIILMSRQRRSKIEHTL